MSHEAEIFDDFLPMGVFDDEDNTSNEPLPPPWDENDILPTGKLREPFNDFIVHRDIFEDVDDFSFNEEEEESSLNSTSCEEENDSDFLGLTTDFLGLTTDDYAKLKPTPALTPTLPARTSYQVPTIQEIVPTTLATSHQPAPTISITTVAVVSTANNFVPPPQIFAVPTTTVTTNFFPTIFVAPTTLPTTAAMNFQPSPSAKSNYNGFDCDTVNSKLKRGRKKGSKDTTTTRKCRSCPICKSSPAKCDGAKAGRRKLGFVRKCSVRGVVIRKKTPNRLAFPKQYVL